jgi:hypothetical protein
VSFFTGRRGKKDRPSDGQVARGHEFGQCRQRGEAAGVVADPRCGESVAIADHVNRLARVEDRIEMGAQHHGRCLSASTDGPDHVACRIDLDAAQTSRPEAARHPLGAR